MRYLIPPQSPALANIASIEKSVLALEKSRLPFFDTSYMDSIPGYSRTVPKNPPGANQAAYNISFTAANYGTYRAICNQIQYGPDIVADQDSAAFIQAFYPHAVYYNQFAVGLEFTTVLDRKNFYEWMLNYTLVTANHIGHVAGMRVQGPYGFDFRGIPAGGAAQDTKTSDVTWPMTTNFVGGYPTNRPKWLKSSFAYGSGSSTKFIPPHLTPNQLPFYPNDYPYGAPQQGNYVPGNAYLQPNSPTSGSVQKVIIGNGSTPASGGLKPHN